MDSDELYVEIKITRKDGTEVMKYGKFLATIPFYWNAGENPNIRIAANGKWLAAWQYVPLVENRT
jgi:hypothetical protein